MSNILSMSFEISPKAPNYVTRPTSHETLHFLQGFITENTFSKYKTQKHAACHVTTIYTGYPRTILLLGRNWSRHKCTYTFSITDLTKIQQSIQIFGVNVQ